MEEEFITMSLKEMGRLEVMEKIASKRITQVKASKLLGLTTRQVIRLCQSYKKEGAKGLVSKRRGQPSNNKLPQVLKDEVVKLTKQHYMDFGPTLAHEKLTELHALELSVESCRQIMMKAGIWKGKKQSVIKVYQMRERRSAYGELVQIDGSPHAWFEDRGPRCTLLVFVDDATGKIMQLYFEEEESTQGYMEASKQYILKHGRPLAYYSDRHGIFRVNAKEAKTGTGETQFSRAMRELDIELINANSPQAKGRVERMNGVLQDRLVKELRLRGISDIKSANQFLAEFIKDYNRKFAKPPASAVDAHRQMIPDSKTLDLILCQRYSRRITKNLEVHYNNKIYQIQTKAQGYTMRGARIEVRDKQGKVTLIYKNKVLIYKVFGKGQNITPIATSKQVNKRVEAKMNKPAADHPWRRYVVKKQQRQASGAHLYTTPQAYPVNNGTSCPVDLCISASASRGDISTLEKR